MKLMNKKLCTLTLNLNDISGATVSIQRSNTICIVLLARILNNIPIVVNVVALLLKYKALKEFGQNAVRRQEVNRTAVLRGGQNFGYEICSDFLRLSGQNTKWKLSELGGRVVQ